MLAHIPGKIKSKPSINMSTMKPKLFIRRVILKLKKLFTKIIVMPLLDTACV
jgi:hypothetical protein